MTLPVPPGWKRDLNRCGFQFVWKNLIEQGGDDAPADENDDEYDVFAAAGEQDEYDPGPSHQLTEK